MTLLEKAKQTNKKIQHTKKRKKKTTHRKSLYALRITVMCSALAEVCNCSLLWNKKILSRFVGTKCNSRNVVSSMFLTFWVKPRGTMAAFFPRVHLFSTCSAELRKKVKKTETIYRSIYIVLRLYLKSL